MKKSIIALTIMSFAALMLSSCADEEININDGNVQKGDLALTIMGTQTRSEAAISSEFEVETNTLSFETEDGSEFILDETVVDLNGLATRGTPAYTENVATLYGEFNAIMYNGASKLHDLGAFKYDATDAKKRWIRHLYVADPFAGIANDGKMSIYMWMPTDMTSKGVTFGTSAYGTTTDGNLTITFDYAGGSSVGTAADQEDIIFSGLKISGSEYDTAVASDAGAPSVFFYHALTGVKFALAADGTEATIEEVTFKGLKDKGTCVITPGATTYYSSGNPDIVSWTPDATTPVSDYSKNTGYSSGSYPVENGKNVLQDFTTKPDDSTLGSTFYGAKSGKKNLNDAAATQTFWFMPQAITKDVTLTIKYKVGTGQSDTFEIKYGELLAANSVQWKAGELRTYFIRVDEVNVMIEDEVNMSEAYTNATQDKWKSAAGSKKENVVITNTGNTPAFIRAAIVGQWIDKDGKPVFAFTDFVDGQLVVEDVPSWYQDQFGSSTTSPAYTFGYFSELVGYKATQTGSKAYTGTHWHKGTDGYYYYDEAVPAGESTEENLFESYTIASVPDISIGGKHYEVTFVLEVATQAISANKADGTQWTSYTDAWDNAKNQ